MTYNPTSIPAVTRQAMRAYRAAVVAADSGKQAEWTAVLNRLTPGWLAGPYADWTAAGYPDTPIARMSGQ